MFRSEIGGAIGYVVILGNILSKPESVSMLLATRKNE